MALSRTLAQAVTVLHFGGVFARGTVEQIIAHRGVEQIYLGTGDVDRTDPAGQRTARRLRRRAGAAGCRVRGDGGKIVAVIGRNGVGKSTLMRTLMGCFARAPAASDSAGRT